MSFIWDVDDWQDNVGKWAETTFPKSDEESVIAHLRDEVNNELHPGCDVEELADCVLLLLHLAHKKGEPLVQAMRIKHGINQRRKWATEKNEKGFFPHVEEPSDAQA